MMVHLTVEPLWSVPHLASFRSVFLRSIFVMGIEAEKRRCSIEVNLFSFSLLTLILTDCPIGTSKVIIESEFV